MQFLDAVNRILRINGVIRGDTDVLVTFSDTAHNATSSLAQIAVQAEIADLSSRELLPYEHKINATLTLATGTRSYALPADFIRLSGNPPFFYDSTNQVHIHEYPGGEDQLREDVFTYRTDQGYPNYFYLERGTTKQVSFFNVPNSSNNNLVLNYDYEADVNVTNSTDTLPFQTNNESYAFCEVAARRFKYLFEGKPEVDPNKDPVYRNARSRLFALMKGKNPSSWYGKLYR